MKKRILGLGNALVDVLARIPSDDWLVRMGLPKGSMRLLDADAFAELGEAIDELSSVRLTGGSAGNVMKALACMGVDAAFVGKTGVDAYGDFYERACREMGVDFVRLTDAERATGVALTFISPDGQRTFGTHLGAASNLLAEDVVQMDFGSCAYFFIEGYLVQNHDLVREAVDRARAQGARICLDLASYNVVEADRDFFGQLLADTDVVFANEEEAFAYTRKEDPAEALEVLADVCGTAVVKIGAEGSLLARGDERVRVEALPCRVVDTTGAGDNYAAGFLYGLLRGLPLEGCGRVGSVLASAVVEHVGATLPDASWPGLMERIAVIH